MAALLQHVWDQPAASETMLADLNLEEAALGAGRRSLVEHGVLVEAPSGRGVELSPRVGLVLSAVTRPRVLGVLQIASAGREPRSAYFSWDQEAIVFSQVTVAGDHILDTLPSLEEIGEAAIGFSSLSGFMKAKEGMAPDPEAVVQAAALRGVFMAVSDPAAVEPATEAVSWLVSGDEIWLMEAGKGEEPQLTPASAAEIGAKVVSMMRAAVEVFQGIRAAPRAPEGNGGSGPRTVRARRDRK